MHIIGSITKNTLRGKKTVELGNGVEKRTGKKDKQWQNICDDARGKLAAFYLSN